MPNDPDSDGDALSDGEEVHATALTRCRAAPTSTTSRTAWRSSAGPIPSTTTPTMTAARTAVTTTRLTETATATVTRCRSTRSGSSVPIRPTPTPRPGTDDDTDPNPLTPTRARHPRHHPRHHAAIRTVGLGPMSPADEKSQLSSAGPRLKRRGAARSMPAATPPDRAADSRRRATLSATRLDSVPVHGETKQAEKLEELRQDLNHKGAAAGPRPACRAHRSAWHQRGELVRLDGEAGVRSRCGTGPSSCPVGWRSVCAVPRRGSGVASVGRGRRTGVARRRNGRRRRAHGRSRVGIAA